MTDPTPTPADLERAREWEEAACLGCGATQGGRFACAECSASLAALLRSVREEGARQERERCAVLADEWAEFYSAHGPSPDSKRAAGRVAQAIRDENTP